LLQEKQVLDIERAKMKLAIVLLQQDDGGGEDDDDDDDDDLLQKRRDAATKLLIEEGVTTADIQPSTSSTDTRIVFQSNPALYRKIDGIAWNETVHGRLEIIQQCVTEEGDVALGCELERRAQEQLQRDEYTSVGSGVKQQQQQSDGNIPTTQSSNDDIATLSDKLQSGIQLNNSEEDDDYPPHPTKQFANSRKAQKAAQKKSKKAKRREKEDAVEREEKIAAERTRQKEREERLGLQKEEQQGGATAVNETASTSNNNTTSQASSSSTTTNTNNGENKACNTCGGSFAPHEYRSHFRSDWHRYNVKLKLKGCATVSEKEFLLCDSDAFF
jgi:hypothetical protein